MFFKRLIFFLREQTKGRDARCIMPLGCSLFKLPINYFGLGGEITDVAGWPEWVARIVIWVAQVAGWLGGPGSMVMILTLNLALFH